MRRRKIRFLGGEYLKWFEFWGYRGSVASYATTNLVGCRRIFRSRIRETLFHLSRSELLIRAKLKTDSA